MVQGLLQEIKFLANVDVWVYCDYRSMRLQLPEGVNRVLADENKDIYQQISQRLCDFDVFWPIAPETDGVLSDLAKLAVSCSAKMCLSSPGAVAVCSDKLKTIQCLQANNIAVVETAVLSLSYRFTGQKVVIKPVDGVGCEQSYQLASEQEVFEVMNRLVCLEDYIIQPYIEGKAMSLSCLFKNGRAWLLCCNEQVVRAQNKRLELQKCIVNIPVNDLQKIQRLVQQIAEALPELWGYIGIDVIDSKQEGLLVLEINPRLTSSYAGIFPATGINVAEQTLKMFSGQPQFDKLQNQQVEIVIKGEISG